MRNQFLSRYSNLIPAGPRGQVTGNIRTHRAYKRADERAIGYVPYTGSHLPFPLPATLVAFYLPQFHTIPENDRWWGRGFTEWRNVTRALPQFEGHVQPRLPGDLGFYDLKNPDTIREQTRLAREYGIGAFCFYFYWFAGKTLLEEPLRNLLTDSSINMPFCLCWANENWSRRWDGRDDAILIAQQHSLEDDLAFISYLTDYLKDPRYLRVDGKPLLLVYRPGLLPDAKATAARWRAWCTENGIGDIHLAYVQSFERPVPADIGFDAAVEFPPNMSSPPSVGSRQHLINPDFSGEILDWRELAKEFQHREPPAYPLYPGVNPGWDNEARRPAQGRVFLHSSPRRYRDWLTHAITERSAAPPDRRLVFINAWNEWAEGAVLEPDAAYGFANLSATRNALISAARSRTRTDRRYAVVHVWHLDVFGEILALLKQSSVDWNLVVTTPQRHIGAVQEKANLAGLPTEIVAVENRGRDILPFLHVANRLIDEDVDIVLKLHTKKSEHRNDGNSWRRELVGRLIGMGRAQTISQAFDADPNLGMVAPEGHILPIGDFTGGNAETIAATLGRLGLEQPQGDAPFVSGSMFWARLSALRPLLDAHLTDSDFESESGQIDGTLAHAIERMFGLCVIAEGFQIKSAASVCHQPESQTPTYRFAKSRQV